jgi:hypothetical protein
MRSRVVSPRDIKGKYQAEVKDFAYAFVLPDHSQEWEEKALSPAEAEAALARAAIEEALASTRSRRSTDKKPKFIEIKPKA